MTLNEKALEAAIAAVKKDDAGTYERSTKVGIEAYLSALSVEGVEPVERFEVTHDPEVGMIHRPHASGYYVRYTDHAAQMAAAQAQIAALQARVEELEESGKKLFAQRNMSNWRALEAEAALAKSGQQVSALRKALEPFAELAEWFDDVPDDEEFAMLHNLRRARQALATLTKENEG